LLPFVEIDELVEALAIDISSDGDLATLSLVLGASDLVPLDALSSARYFWLGIDCNLLLLLPVVIRTSPALSSSSFSEVKLWPFIFFSSGWWVISMHSCEARTCFTSTPALTTDGRTIAIY